MPLTRSQRRSVHAAQSAGWLRPMDLPRAQQIGSPHYVRGIGWLACDVVGVLRDACGPVHRPGVHHAR